VVEMSRTTPSPVPLARLLALAYRQIIDELHRRLKEAGYTDVRPKFGYVLLALRERPATGTDIAQLLAVTKQAASKLIDEMERGGYVKREIHEYDARAKGIVITARGRKILATVEAIYADIERDWARITSKQGLEAIRRDLRTIVESAHGGQLPSIRPTM